VEGCTDAEGVADEVVPDTGAVFWAEVVPRTEVTAVEVTTTGAVPVDWATVVAKVLTEVGTDAVDSAPGFVASETVLVPAAVVG